jgi:hypothetical protein
VIEKELPRARINGIVRWVADRPLIQLSLRHRWADIFWFTFFHEAAHLLLHDRRKLTFVDAGAGSDSLEIEADHFAARTLIPREFDDDLAAVTRNAESIQALAKHIDVDPGVVVGRLQHDRRLRFNELNSLRTRFYFEDDYRTGRYSVSMGPSTTLCLLRSPWCPNMTSGLDHLHYGGQIPPTVMPTQRGGQIKVLGYFRHLPSLETAPLSAAGCGVSHRMPNPSAGSGAAT